MTGFPQDPTKLEVGAAFGANLSTALSSLTYTALTPTYVKPFVTITRGRIGDARQAQPTQIDFGLKNPLGIFSPRNIAGPNFGNLRQNTPIRVRLDPGTGYVTRAIGYNPNWPVRWTGPNIDDRIETSALGITSRLGQGQGARSALRRSLPFAGGVAYWPMEEGLGATSAEALIGSAPMLVDSTGPVGGGTPFALGSAGAWSFSAGGSMSGAVTVGSAQDEYEMQFSVAFSTLDSPAVDTARIVAGVFDAGDGASDFGGGSFANVLMKFNGTSWYWGVHRIYDAGSAILAYDTTTPIVADRVYSVRMSIGDVAGFFTALVAVDGVALATATEIFSVTGDIRPKRVILNRYVYPALLPGANPAAISHVEVWSPRAGFGYPYVAGAYADEEVDTRFGRLCTEDAIAYNIAGTTTEPMGPQPVANIADLLRECQETAEGVMLERRTGELGLDLLSSRYDKAAALTFSYAVATDIQPGDDDRDTVNYAAVTRNGGSFRTGEVTTGPLGSSLVTGVGRYDGSTSRSLYTDDQASNHAGWITAVGTVDEQRQYVVLNLRDKTSLITQWLACDIGSRVQVTSPPAIQTGPAPLDLIIEGYREVLDGTEWWVELWLMPYAPYQVLKIETGSDNTSRIAASSILAAGYTATDTSLSVTSTSAAGRWIDSATYPSKFPIVIKIAGERMTCTAITGTTATQTFTVTRGLDGVTKALPSGSAVQVDHPAAIAL